MPLTAWSHTGFLQCQEPCKLSTADKLHLAISDATKQATLEGRGVQYEVPNGIVTIAHLEDVDLPASALDGDTATNNLIVIANPVSIGTMLVLQLTTDQNTNLVQCHDIGDSIGVALIHTAFQTGVSAPLPDLVRRLHSISKLNEEWADAVKPRFAAIIQEGNATIHEIMQGAK
jgi:hypothetical protein